LNLSNAANPDGFRSGNVTDSRNKPGCERK
jgi:hypothetical protein